MNAVVATFIQVAAAFLFLCLPGYFAQQELIEWKEDRYLSCVFCLDYDDRQKMSIFGCSLAKPPTCYGNICYMRQHKSNHYYLYTSGCLNLTQSEYNVIGKKLSSTKPIRGARGEETQLCEVTPQINACVCSNRFFCNNVSSGEPFTEYTFNFLQDIHFDELAHFRFFAPNDPVLLDFETFKGHLSSASGIQLQQSFSFAILFLLLNYILIITNIFF